MNCPKYSAADNIGISKREGNVSWYHLFDDPLVAIVFAESDISSLDKFPVDKFGSEDYIETFRGQDTDNARMFRKNNIHPNIKFETEDTYASHHSIISLFTRLISFDFIKKGLMQ